MKPLVTTSSYRLPHQPGIVSRSSVGVVAWRDTALVSVLWYRSPSDNRPTIVKDNVVFCLGEGAVGGVVIDHTIICDVPDNTRQQGVPMKPHLWTEPYVSLISD